MNQEDEVGAGMINLRKFQGELGRLERSLALEAIWPGVFDAGKVTTHWVATPVGRNYRGIDCPRVVADRGQRGR